MKTYIKTLFLAPVVLVALTACEAKMSAEKAEERAKGYDAAAVSEQYASFDVYSKPDVKKATGLFDPKTGALNFMTQMLTGDLDEKDQPVEEGVYVYGDGNTDGEDESVETTYYSYKKTGLKIVVVSTLDQDQNGIKVKGKSTQVAYVLDDGRLEKSTLHAKMSADGSVGGVSVTGELEVKATVTYTWNAK